MFNDRRRLVTFLFMVLLMFAYVPAHAVPEFSFGVSETNVVVASTTVSVLTAITNTGTDAIAFGPSGTLSPGGSFVQTAAGWNIGQNAGVNTNFVFGTTGPSTASFFAQFENVTVNPGETFNFTMATFTAPNLPLGSTTYYSVGFFLFPTAGGNATTFVRRPISWTIGTEASASPLTFSTIDVAPVQFGAVPEPSTILLLQAVLVS